MMARTASLQAPIVVDHHAVFDAGGHQRGSKFGIRDGKFAEFASGHGKFAGKFQRFAGKDAGFASQDGKFAARICVFAKENGVLVGPAALGVLGKGDAACAFCH
jgi:hypothetical protein